MKLFLAAAAAMIAMPAIAQNTPAPPSPDPQTAPMPAAPPAAPLPPPPGPATGPANMVMGPPTPVVQPLPDAAPPATGADAPWCTKTVVDHCKERSNARGERLHSTPRPHGK
jgi:hypothetical protein